MKASANYRLLSLLLAVLLLVTFTVPASAMGFDDLSTVIDITGEPLSETDIPNDDPDSSQEEADVEESSLNSTQMEKSESDRADISQEAAAPIQAKEDTPLGISSFSEEDLAVLQKQMDAWANGLHLARNPRLRAAAGDTGTVTKSTISVNSYNVTVPGAGNAYGSIMYRMKINGEDAFCTQVWRLVGGSTYTAGNAASGNSTTAKYLANFAASGKSNADYVAAQVLVWESLYGDIGLYSQIIAGTGYVSNYNSIKNGNNSGEGLLFWTSGATDQEIVTLIIENDGDEEPEIPPPDDGDDEEEENPNTSTTTETTTDTEVRITEEYTYSDAIGQITICKRDDKGVSLDGAIFNIKVEFANGEVGGDSSFEVYNGSRLFTYTHPADDHEPAQITVTEVRAPDGYIGTNQPQTATPTPMTKTISRSLKPIL